MCDMHCNLVCEKRKKWVASGSISTSQWIRLLHRFMTRRAWRPNLYSVIHIYRICRIADAPTNNRLMYCKFTPVTCICLADIQPFESHIDLKTNCIATLLFHNYPAQEVDAYALQKLDHESRLNTSCTTRLCDNDKGSFVTWAKKEQIRTHQYLPTR